MFNERFALWRIKLWIRITDHLYFAITFEPTDYPKRDIIFIISLLLAKIGGVLSVFQEGIRLK